MNHVLNTDLYCKLIVFSSGVIYYFVYLKINCIYTKNTLLRLEALVAELGAIRQQTITTLIQSMRNICLAVIAAGGGHTSY
jgi:hypothetical protein